MKEPCGEGLASHTDPESCVGSRKAGHEVLTGAHADGVLSREISRNKDADAVYSAGRQHWWVRHREYPLDLRGQRPRYVWNLHVREPGGPTSVRHEAVIGPVEKGDEPQSRHERWWGVGWSCSTCEVPEQGWKSLTGGGHGGKTTTKENTGQRAASQMQSWGNALAGLHRVREAAKRDKRLRFTALLHHVSFTLLANSFYALKRGAAPGVDGLTWQEYETDLDKRLGDLHSRVHRSISRATFQESLYSQGG